GPKSAPPFEIASGDSIMPARSTSWASKAASGRLRWNTTVAGSLTSTDWTLASSLLRGELAAVRIRSMLNLTTSAAKAVPSWNLTPWRRVKASVVGCVYVQAVASPGLMVSVWSMETRDSYML